MKKIKLVVVEFNSSGGLIHYAYQLCSALSKNGINVTLITGEQYELFNLPHNFNVEKRLKLWHVFDTASMNVKSGSRIIIFYLKIKWMLRRCVRAAKLIKEWISLTNFLIELKPDIIQFGEIKFPFEAIFLARLHRHQLVLSQICHEFERREGKSKLSTYVDFFFSFTFRYFSVIFFHAEANRKRFLSKFNYPQENIHVIPHGNESIFNIAAKKPKNNESIRQRYFLRDNQSVILFFGLLTPSKGLPDLIDAFAIVNKYIKAKLIIAGYPTKEIDAFSLKTRADRHGIADHIVFDTRYIPIEDISELMNLANVVVFPYHSATQSGSLQVAFSFGRPVVATSVGGLPEVVKDGKSGFLVPPRSPHDLAEKILTILNSPKLACKMGRYALQISENYYGWDPIAQKICKIYNNVLKRKSKTG